MWIVSILLVFISIIQLMNQAAAGLQLRPSPDSKENLSLKECSEQGEGGVKIKGIYLENK